MQMMRLIRGAAGTVPILFVFLVASTPTARADYAVLRSGARIHVSSYEAAGDRMRLYVPGGTVELPIDDIVSVEPEDTFPANTAALPNDEHYSTLIRAASLKHGVDEELIEQVIATESNFDPHAVSHKFAMGLMQLLPGTAARYSVVNVYDPAENIDGGTRYLRDLLVRYRGSVQLALAAYNAGPGTVDHYGGVPPFPETRSYVRRITEKLSIHYPHQTRGR
jgi:soluble lytic murein transglycosylase-like protein